jgi:hypothetical protein
MGAGADAAGSGDGRVFLALPPVSPAEAGRGSGPAAGNGRYNIQANVAKKTKQASIWLWMRGGIGPGGVWIFLKFSHESCSDAAAANTFLSV